MVKGKFRKGIAIFMALLLCVGSVAWDSLTTKAASLTSKQPDAGTGMQGAPYEINEASELLWFAESVNNGNTTINAVLTADIDINPGYTFSEDGKYTTDTSAGDLVVWTPIGNSSNQFSGSFDGQEHSVSGLYIMDSGKQDVGLFGSLTVNGEVSNLQILNSYLEGYNAGGICGTANGIISNCSSKATVKGYFGVGGICGDGSATISHCYNEGKILVESSGYRRGFGGICGIHRGGTISKSVNVGHVTGYDDVAGICGLAWGNVVIKNSYNVGEISGGSRIGGIAGEPYNSSCSMTVENCFNAGEITGSSYIGQIIGLGTASNCYYLAENETDDIEGTTYKTSAQFANGEVTFLLNNSSSDYESETALAVWYQNIDNGLEKDEYPLLSDDSGKVYAGYSGCKLQYTNLYPNDLTTEISHEEYSNGYCTECGEMQNPFKTMDKYDVNGDGEKDIVYEISNAGQLYWFASYVNAGNNATHAVLVNDIIVNDKIYENGVLVSDTENLKTWTPIGNKTTQYKGVFDGQNHLVKGLYFNDSKVEYVGLFGYINQGSILNVGVIEPYFYGYMDVAGICGYNNKGEIINCYNKGNISSSGNYASGICGNNYYGTISNCYNEGDINGGEAAGICAQNSYGTIQNSYNLGDIKSTTYYGGGICATQSTSSGNGKIVNCYSTGDVSTKTNSNAGGILGYMYPNTSTAVKNCYYLSGLGNSGTYGGISKTSAQFASGEVAYKLQSQQDGTAIVWGQILGQEIYPMLQGQVIYNVENCNGGAYSNVNVVGKHNFMDGECTVCKISEMECMANLCGYTISLTGDIAVNFYMQLSDEIVNDEAAYMLFTFADGDISKFNVSDAEVKKDGENVYYVLKCKVQSPEISDTFTAKLITQVCDMREYSYSVKTYADYILNNTENNAEYAKAAPMIKAMLNYGGYVQKQFGHNTGSLANAGLYSASEDPVLVGTVPALTAHAFTAPSKNVGVKYYGTSLLLNSETTIRHYFTFTEGEDIAEIREKYEFKLADGTVLTPIMRGGMIYIDIKDISAADLDVKYDVTVTNKTTLEIFTFSYSALSYAKYVLDYALAGTNLVNVIKAMYFYNEAANSYFR